MNSNFFLIQQPRLLRKKSQTRHSGEACAGLDPVAGVQKLLKALDSAKASLRARVKPGMTLN